MGESEAAPQETDVSIVVINWNRCDDVLRALKYLRFQSHVRFEVIVVDNGSTDGSPEKLGQLEGIALIGLKANVGACKARNVAIDRARGRYILFLDSDAVLSKWKLETLVKRMDQDPSIGILTCRIVNGYTRGIDQWFHGASAADSYRREFDTYSFTAAGAILRAQAIHDAGPFWDELFIYNEEVDLSVRVLRAGYRIVYFPEVKVYHSPSQMGRGGSGSYWRFQIRNWIWIFYRHYPFWHRIRNIGTYIPIYLIKSTMNLQLGSCCRGIIEGLRKTEIIEEYPEKLTPTEIRRFRALNSRTKIKLSR